MCVENASILLLLYTLMCGILLLSPNVITYVIIHVDQHCRDHHTPTGAPSRPSLPAAMASCRPILLAVSRAAGAAANSIVVPCMFIALVHPRRHHHPMLSRHDSLDPCCKCCSHADVYPACYHAKQVKTGVPSLALRTWSSIC